MGSADLVAAHSLTAGGHKVRRWKDQPDLRQAAHRYFEHQADLASPTANDPLMSLTSPGAVQYIDDTARQQLAYVGMINYYNIDTQGGSYVGGSVITGRRLHRAATISDRRSRVYLLPGSNSTTRLLSMQRSGKGHARTLRRTASSPPGLIEQLW